MKLFVKDAKVKMSENLSSWALQSGESKTSGAQGGWAKLLSILAFLPGGHPTWLRSRAAPSISDSSHGRKFSLR